MDVGPQILLWALLYYQQVVAQLHVRPGSVKWDTKVMESSLKDEIEAGGSLLNQANAEPFSMMAKALHCTGS